MLKSKLLFLTLLTISIWADNTTSLNGIFTFDEYNNISNKRTGITSFELMDGKETSGYKVATGSFPYRHKSGSVVFNQGCGLSIINKDGFTTSVAPCPKKEGTHEKKYQHPQLSEDGLFVAVETIQYVYVDYANSYYDYNTVVFDIAGKKVATFKKMFSPTWLPDGRLLLSSSANKYGLFMTDKDFNKITQIDNNKLQAYAYNPDVSPDGKRIVFEYNQQIWMMDIDGTKLKRLLRGSKKFKYPTWSPDGKYIAYLRMDSRKYYDEAIYLFEVDGEHKQFTLNTRKIFEQGETGYPDITGGLSWVSSDFLTEKKKSHTTMKDIEKIGYTKESFSTLIALLEFTIDKKLTKEEKIALVDSDYKYARGDLTKRSKSMQRTLKSFVEMNQEVQRLKGKKHYELMRTYLEDMLLQTYKNAPLERKNAFIVQLLEEHEHAIHIQDKAFKPVPLQYNKESSLKDTILVESANIKKLKESSWIKSFYKQEQTKHLKSTQKLQTLFTLTENTKVTGLVEFNTKDKKTAIYYGKGETPLALWKYYKTIGENHYRVNKLDIFTKPWGYKLFTDVQSATQFDNNTPLYLLNTSNIPLGYIYLLNLAFPLNIGFNLNRDNPSTFQREMMSHIDRMQLKIEGEKTPKIDFKLWFDDELYASTFISILKFKKIELQAYYSYKTPDEWLLDNLEFKKEGKIVKVEQAFSKTLTDEFLKRLIDEIKRYKGE